MDAKIGQDVFFYEGSNIGGVYYAAKIVKVGREVTDLVVFGRGAYGTELRECVRHFTDPRLQSNPHIRKDGCWSEEPNPKPMSSKTRQAATDSTPEAKKSNKKPEAALV